MIDFWQRFFGYNRDEPPNNRFTPGGGTFPPFPGNSGAGGDFSNNWETQRPFGQNNPGFRDDLGHPLWDPNNPSEFQDPKYSDPWINPTMPNSQDPRMVFNPDQGLPMGFGSGMLGLGGDSKVYDLNEMQDLVSSLRGSSPESLPNPAPNEVMQPYQPYGQLPDVPVYELPPGSPWSPEPSPGTLYNPNAPPLSPGMETIGYQGNLGVNEGFPNVGNMSNDQLRYEAERLGVPGLPPAVPAGPGYTSPALQGQINQYWNNLGNQGFGLTSPGWTPPPGMPPGQELNFGASEFPNIPGGGNVSADQLANPPGLYPTYQSPGTNIQDFGGSPIDWGQSLPPAEFAPPEDTDVGGGSSGVPLTEGEPDFGGFPVGGGGPEAAYQYLSPDGQFIYKYDENMNWIGQSPAGEGGIMGDTGGGGRYPTPPGVTPDVLPAQPYEHPGIHTSDLVHALAQDKADQSLGHQLGLPTNYKAVGQFFKDAAGNIVDATGKIISSAADLASRAGGSLLNAGGALANNIMNNPGYSSPGYLASIGYEPGQGIRSQFPASVTGPSTGYYDTETGGIAGQGGSFFHGSQYSPGGIDPNTGQPVFDRGPSAMNPQGYNYPTHGATSVAGAFTNLGGMGISANVQALGGWNNRAAAEAEAIRRSIMAGTYRPTGGTSGGYPAPALASSARSMALSRGFVQVPGSPGSFAPPGATPVNWDLVGANMRAAAARTPQDLGRGIRPGQQGRSQQVPP